MSDWESFRQRRHFANLDGIRALSILAVIWHHGVGPIGGFPATSRGFLGVDMFFVLSGFLIVTLLLRERDRTGRISLGQFYARRTLRIFPLYYLVVAIVGALSWIRQGGAYSLEAYVDALPFLLTYTSNWVPDHPGMILAVAWSLASEEQFYLVWPPLERFAPRLSLWVLAGLLVYCEALNFQLVAPPWGLERESLSILQVTFAPILIGVLLAHVLHGQRGFDLVRRVVGGRHASTVAFALLMIIVSVPNPDISGAHRLSIHVVMTALLASLLVREGVGLGPIAASRPLVRIGRVSYGMYLWHMLVLTVSLRVVGDIGLANGAVLFVLTLFVSELSFRYFERPFLAMKARFTSRVAPRTDALVAES